MSNTNTVVAPTAWVTSVFGALGKLKWHEMASEIEKKSNNSGITTSEHVAEAVTKGLADSGHTVEVGATSMLPTAESLLGIVLNMIPSLHKAAGTKAPVAAKPFEQPTPPKPAEAAQPKNAGEDQSRQKQTAAAQDNQAWRQSINPGQHDGTADAAKPFNPEWRKSPNNIADQGQQSHPYDPSHTDKPMGSSSMPNSPPPTATPYREQVGQWRDQAQQSTRE